MAEEPHPDAARREYLLRFLLEVWLGGSPPARRLEYLTGVLLGLYFDGQAEDEARIGREAVPAWGRQRGASTAAEIRKTISDPADRAARVLAGLDTMLDIYPGSVKTLSRVDGGYQLTVERCGIYAYRENRGVRLTLGKPCEYCVPMHQGESAGLGLQLTSQLGDRGCIYTVRVPEGGGDGN